MGAPGVEPASCTHGGTPREGRPGRDGQGGTGGDVRREPPPTRRSGIAVLPCTRSGFSRERTRAHDAPGRAVEIDPARIARRTTTSAPEAAIGYVSTAGTMPERRGRRRPIRTGRTPSWPIAGRRRSRDHGNPKAVRTSEHTADMQSTLPLAPLQESAVSSSSRPMARDTRRAETRPGPSAGRAGNGRARSTRAAGRQLTAPTRRSPGCDSEIRRSRSVRDGAESPATRLPRPSTGQRIVTPEAPERTWRMADATRLAGLRGVAAARAALAASAPQASRPAAPSAPPAWRGAHLRRLLAGGGLLSEEGL